MLISLAIRLTSGEVETRKLGIELSILSSVANCSRKETGNTGLMQGVMPGLLETYGFYLEPTLVEVEDPTNPFTQEEVLAPVAALLKAGSAEEAMQIADGVRQGLVAAVYTNDLDRAMEFANHLELSHQCSRHALDL
jgi:acyl-CoA reductase-like NAD-dependent aldehyde dehydrogenase